MLDNVQLNFAGSTSTKDVLTILVQNLPRFSLNLVQLVFHLFIELETDPYRLAV